MIKIALFLGLILAILWFLWRMRYLFGRIWAFILRHRLLQLLLWRGIGRLLRFLLTRRF